MARRSFLVSLLALLACACAPRYPTDADFAADGGGAADAAAGDDRDGDGVCDATERDVGSNPDERDTDGDLFPDALELVNAFDPRDPSSPGIDQVAFMAASKGNGVELSLRATVEGQGETYSGVLTSYPSLDAEDRVADDFLAAVRAESAEPPENVRVVDAEAARFEAVLGKTRLSFRVRFEYQGSEDFPCAQGYSFTYATKSDQGRIESTRDYMLVITPKDQAGRDVDAFCLPAACL